MSGAKHVVITVNAAWNLLNYRTGIIDMLLQQGHRVTLLAPEDETVDALKALGCAFEPIAMTRRGTSLLAEAGVFLTLCRKLRQLKPDAVLSFTIKNNIYAGLACRLMRIPFSPNVSGRGAVFSGNGRFIRAVLAAYRTAFARASRVFYQNPEDREYFLSNGVGQPARAGLLPGSGIDLTRFDVAPLPAREQAPCFLMVSRVLKDKGVAEYAAAAKQVQQVLPKARFVLIGAHQQGKDYVPQAQLDAWQAEGVIDYKGVVSDVRGLVRAADAVVLPSYYLEGTPRALLEAAAMGRPIITTDTAGCRDVVIEGENGFIVPPRNAADLEKAILRFATSDPDIRSAMGRASRQLAETRFDVRFVVAAYRDALEAVFR